MNTTSLSKNKKKRRETLTKKLDFWRKGTHKHMEAKLKYFNDHRCLSRSEESKSRLYHVFKQRTRTSRQNLILSPKNCDQEDGMEHTHSCPMLQVGVEGENESTMCSHTVINTF